MQIKIKAKKIKLLVLDVDGVMTSGLIYYGSEDIDIKGFFIHDGLGIKLLQQSGVTVAIISAKKSLAVERRLRDLDVTVAYLGYHEKLTAYDDLKQKFNLADENIAYMGDDLPDLPVLKRVGLSVSVPQAPEIVQKNVDYITQKKGGKGAVREVCELIMHSQETYEKIVNQYLV